MGNASKGSKKVQLHSQLVNEGRPNLGHVKKQQSWGSRIEDRERLYKQRDIFVWITEKGRFDHSGVMFGYTTRVKNGSRRTIKVRKHYQVDLYVNDIEVFLQFNAKDTAHYHKNPQYEIRACLADIQDIAIDTFCKFGRYNILSNNCQHYADNLVNALVTGLKMTTVKNSKSFLDLKESVVLDQPYLDSRVPSAPPKRSKALDCVRYQRTSSQPNDINNISESMFYRARSGVPVEDRREYQDDLQQDQHRGALTHCESDSSFVEGFLKEDNAKYTKTTTTTYYRYQAEIKLSL